MDTVEKLLQLTLIKTSTHLTDIMKLLSNNIVTFKNKYTHYKIHQSLLYLLSNTKTLKKED